MAAHQFLGWSRAGLCWHVDQKWGLENECVILPAWDLSLVFVPDPHTIQKLKTFNVGPPICEALENPVSRF